MLAVASIRWRRVVAVFMALPYASAAFSGREWSPHLFHPETLPPMKA